MFRPSLASHRRVVAHTAERAILRWLFALAVVAAFLPAPAGAATFTYLYGNNSSYKPASVYLAAAGEANNLVVTTSADAGGKRVILDDVVNVYPGPAIRVEDRSGDYPTYECTRPDPGDMTRLSCPLPAAQDRYGSVLASDAPLTIVLGDGNDRLSYRNAIVKFQRLFIYGDEANYGHTNGGNQVGNDTISVEDALTTTYFVNGGPGNDTISGNVPGVGIRFFGGRGNDRISCGALDCGAEGDAGRDVLIGGPGADFLIGGDYSGDFPDSADILRGNAGNDLLCGGPGPDRIFGGAGHDVMNPGGAIYNTTNGKLIPDRGGINIGGPGKDRVGVVGSRFAYC